MICNIDEAKANLSKLVNMAYHGGKVIIAKNNSSRSCRVCESWSIAVGLRCA